MQRLWFLVAAFALAALAWVWSRGLEAPPRAATVPAAGTPAARTDAPLPDSAAASADAAGRRRQVPVPAAPPDDAEGGSDAHALVAGRVVDPQQRPIAGADVVFFAGQWHLPRHAATSAPDGTFSFRAASAGTVVAQKAGWLSGRAHASKAAGTGLVLVMTPGGHVIRGLVLDPAGAPVPDALVVLSPGDALAAAGERPHTIVLRTDPRGAFATPGGAAGPWTIRSRAPPFAMAEAVCEAGDAMQPVILVLRRGAVVHGVLRDAEGRTVPGQVMRARRERGLAGLDDVVSEHLTDSETTTLADGAFRLEGVTPGRMWLHAMVSEPKNHNALLRDGEVFEWNPVDAPVGALAIRGVLEGPRGERLAGWRVRTSRVEMSTMQIEQSSATADADGRFELRELRPLAYDLTLLLPGSGFEPVARRVGVRAGGGELVWRVPFAAADCGSLQGSVVGTDGDPLQGLRLSATMDGVRRQVAAGADGSVRWPLLPPGTWSVRGRAEDYGIFHLGTWQVAAGSETRFGELRLPERGRAIVRVHGGPPDGLRLFLMAADERTRRIRDFTAEAGAFRTPLLPPGRYELVATGAAIAPVRIAVEIAPGADVDVEVRPEPATPVEVAFRPEELAGEPWRDHLTIELRDAAGQVLFDETRTVEGGDEHLFCIGLRSGGYTVTGRSYSRVQRSGEAQFTVADGVDGPVEVPVLLAVR